MDYSLPSQALQEFFLPYIGFKDRWGCLSSGYPEVWCSRGSLFWLYRKKYYAE